jgi:hypothetical protein
MKYQIYSQDKTGKLLHAGVHMLGTISHKTVKKLERKWLMWAVEFINKHPGDYPLRRDINIKVAYVTIFPIDNPKQQRLFTL